MKLSVLYTLLMIGLLILGCSERKEVRDQEESSRLYAISWYYPNNDYQRWVRTQDSTARFIQLYDQRYDRIDSILATCDGLILTGGSDIAPDRFGADDSLAQCGKSNLRRDSIELLALHWSLENGIPTLGVCRGMQIINVGLGGDLILDIPSEMKSNIHQQDSGDAHHMIFASKSFSEMVSSDSALTNSNHHQALDRLGNKVIPVAWSKDSIVEAIHVSDTSQHPFLWGVQWHPERMDQKSPFARNLLEAFLVASRKPNPKRLK